MKGSGELGCRAVLFDLDGVLVRSGTVVERSWTERARDRGLEPARVLASRHGRRSVEVVAEVAAHPDAAAGAAHLEARQAADADGLTRCRGAHAVPAALSGGAWAVVTPGTRALAHAGPRGTGLPVPDVLATADDVASGKSAPDGCPAASRALGVPPAERVGVADALPGVTAAPAAGMPVTGVRGPALGPGEAPARAVGAVGGLAPRLRAGRVVLPGGARRPRRVPPNGGPNVSHGPAHPSRTRTEEAS
ncbi:HAD family hydrolase [Streptomyces achromogenes]|uniref:HAD family hydrolase n=1 Tax=Streptomyces achromogenes TaxID=67255 RepID=UPI0036FAE5ED